MKPIGIVVSIIALALIGCSGNGVGQAVIQATIQAGVQATIEAGQQISPTQQPERQTATAIIPTQAPTAKPSQPPKPSSTSTLTSTATVTTALTSTSTQVSTTVPTSTPSPRPTVRPTSTSVPTRVPTATRRPTFTPNPTPAIVGRAKKYAGLVNQIVDDGYAIYYRLADLEWPPDKVTDEWLNTVDQAVSDFDRLADEWENTPYPIGFESSSVRVSQGLEAFSYSASLMGKWVSASANEKAIEVLLDALSESNQTAFGELNAARIDVDQKIAALSSDGSSGSRASELELQDSRCYKETSGNSGGLAYVKGNVKNISSRRLETIEAVVTWHTRANEFVVSDSALIQYDPLMPGNSSPFEIATKFNPAMDVCSLVFKKRGGNQISHRLKALPSLEATATSEPTDYFEPVYVKPLIYKDEGWSATGSGDSIVGSFMFNSWFGTRKLMTYQPSKSASFDVNIILVDEDEQVVVEMDNPERSDAIEFDAKRGEWYYVIVNTNRPDDKWGVLFETVDRAYNTVDVVQTGEIIYDITDENEDSWTFSWWLEVENISVHELPFEAILKLWDKDGYAVGSREVDKFLVGPNSTFVLKGMLEIEAEVAAEIDNITTIVKLLHEVQ